MYRCEFCTPAPVVRARLRVAHATARDAQLRRNHARAAGPVRMSEAERRRRVREVLAWSGPAAPAQRYGRYAGALNPYRAASDLSSRRLDERRDQRYATARQPVYMGHW
jgi:hypothetical protein